MAMYELSQLTKLWAQEKITPEQAVGQLLLHINELAERVGRLERVQQNHRLRQPKPVTRETP